MSPQLAATSKRLSSLLAEIAAQQVELFVEGERVIFRDPANTLSEMQRQAIQNLQPEILAELRKGQFITQTYPLTNGQRSLWFMHQTLRSSHAHNIGFAVRIQPPLDHISLRAALQTLVNRHASLRTVFRVQENGELCQQVLAYQPLSFEQADCSGWHEDEVRRQVTLAYRQRFNLEAGPVFRASTFSDGKQHHSLLLCFHHIVFDGPSMFMLLRELQEIYAARQSCADPTLRPLKHHYRDFVEWQTEFLQGPAGEAHLAWWKAQLKGAPQVLDLPADHSRPAHVTGHGGSIVLKVDGELVDKLRQLAKERKAYLYDIFLAAYQILLYRYSNQNDLLVGFVTSGRTQLRFAKVCGLFISPIAVRATFPSGLGFLDFLDRQHHSLAECLEHQDYPFLTLVEKSDVTRLPGCMPLIQVLFNFFKAPRGAALEELFITGHQGNPVSSPGLTLETFGLLQDDTEFDLTLEVADGQRCWLRLRYSAELFAPETIARMSGHYLNLLRGIAEDPESSVLALPLMDNEERGRMLLTLNYQERDYPLDTPVHKLFEEQSARTPDRIALISGTDRLTYAELNRQANALAHFLRQEGVGLETLVGICLDRSNQMVVALLAILKAGGAYVPLDPSFPRARLELILKDSQPPIVLTESRLLHLVPATGARLFQMDTERAEYSSAPTENHDSQTDRSSLAYLLYTSGSGGQPKGVQIPHGAFTNFQLSMRERPGLVAEDVLLAVTTISFDIAGLELFLPLISGACVVIASKDAALDGRLLKELIHRHSVTWMQATPATWRLLIDSGWTSEPRLKALCGGEALSRELADELLARAGSLWNVYGPTETTVWSTVQLVEPGDGPILLGTPVANTTIYILDAKLQPVPAGIPGELFIGGSGCARGYMNRPDLTSAQFLDDPFRPGERVYRTGDCCKYNSGGGIVFLGRMDDQIKIRGHRIEPGDIESALHRVPQVRDAVVVAAQDSSGGKRLVAYLLSHSGEGKASTAELREALAGELPDYMIPSAFVYLDAFPLTPNHKVDRKAMQSLPPPKVETDHTFEAPATPTEKAVAEMWQRVLNASSVGSTDKFEELGGDSLSFALMIVRLSKQFRVDLPVSMEKGMLTVRGLAHAIDLAIQPEPVVPGESMPAAANGNGASRPEVPQQSWSGALLVRITSGLLRLVATVECEGEEHIPRSGPLLIAGNHMSFFDFLIIGSVLGDKAISLGVRPAFIIADKWRNYVHAYATHFGSPIYIRRGKGDHAALAEAVEVLEDKGVLAIMPEGKPSRKGLLKAKPGAAYLAEQTDADVLPMAIFGHERAFRFWRRLQRVPVKVRFGRPFKLAEAPANADLQVKADFIMQGIARMMPASYHGVYGSNGASNGSPR